MEWYSDQSVAYTPMSQNQRNRSELEGCKVPSWSQHASFIFQPQNWPHTFCHRRHAEKTLAIVSSSVTPSYVPG
jgi:hypothetical protein